MQVVSFAPYARRIGATVAAAAFLAALTPATASASVPIVFELTGTFPDDVVVSYFGPDDQPIVETSGVPWSMPYDYNGSARSLTFSGIHPGGDPGSVTCRVSISGRTIVTHTNNAPKAAGVGALCNVVDLGRGYVGN